MKNQVFLKCPNCSKERWVRHYQTTLSTHTGLCKSCSSKETVKTMARPQSEGAWHYERGYKLIRLLPNDFFYPMVNNKGFVREHRLVVARALGRCLHLGEVVHHKRGFAKDDNRYPETLQLNTVNGHNTISAMQNKIDALERRIKELLQKNKK